MNWKAFQNVVGVWCVGDDDTMQLLAKVPAGSIGQKQIARLMAAAPNLRQALANLISAVEADRRAEDACLREPLNEALLDERIDTSARLVIRENEAREALEQAGV